MIRDSYVLSEAMKNAGQAILKLLLDTISSYPYILILGGITFIFLIILFIILLVYVLLKWSGKNITVHLS